VEDPPVANVLEETGRIEASRVFDWLLGSPLAVGDAAPDFSAPDQDGNIVSLKALRGRNVILVFYPADDTAVCTKQLCEFRDSWASVSSKNAVVFGVNPAQPGKHDKFRKKYNLSFPLLVDESQKIAKAYHSSFSFAPRRTVYLIGTDGLIRFAGRGKPSPSEVLAAAA
jgi:peroxiredoxin Q/BCP